MTTTARATPRLVGSTRSAISAASARPSTPRSRPVDAMDSIARAFLLEMQACVRAVDFERARALFDPDVTAFGTYAAVITGRERLEQEQWRNVWPTIRE